MFAAEGSKHYLYMQSLNESVPASVQYIHCSKLVYCTIDIAEKKSERCYNISAVIFQSAEFAGKRTAAGQRVYLTENMHTEWLLVLLFICIVY